MQDTDTTAESNRHTATDPANREARLTRDGDGEPVGIAVWLNANQLAALGVDVDTADAVAYRVVNGDLHVDTVRGSGE